MSKNSVLIAAAVYLLSFFIALGANAQVERHSPFTLPYKGTDWHIAFDGPVDSEWVIYFFHGAEGSELTWRNSFDDLHRQIIDKAPIDPLVVSVSLGKKWLLVNTERSLLDDFLSHILPEIEGSRQATTVRRDVIGFSMGGYNALQIALDAPGLVDNLVLISPAVVDLSPYASYQQIDEYAQRGGLISPLRSLLVHWGIVERKQQPVEVILETYRSFIGSEADWPPNNVLRKLEALSDPAFKSLYLSCGKEDPYALCDGVQKMASSLKNKDIAVRADVLSGGHMIRNDEYISDFLF